MNLENQKPYEFARGRFLHACFVLMNTDQSIHERLLDAIVALAPLRVEDLPRTCYLFYERVQHLIGAELWSDGATSGSLGLAVRELSEHQAADAVQWILLACETLDEHLPTVPTTQTVQ